MDINYALELEPYVDGWHRVKYTDEKIISCSPFRYESTPSFAVNLETGVWVDSGASGTEHYKGNFTSLLAFLRDETYEDTKEYLWDVYGRPLKDVDNLSISVNLKKEVEKPLKMDRLSPYRDENGALYLSSRGIGRDTCARFEIGADPATGAVAIPHFDRKGRLINIKFRRTDSKRFYYLEDGGRLKNHVYGLDKVYQDKAETVYIVESETDALYLWTYGYPAIALSGASLSKRQRELILASPIKHLIIATDNDTVGVRCARQLVGAFGGTHVLSRLLFPSNAKDVNDFTNNEMKELSSKSLKLQIKR